MCHRMCPWQVACAYIMAYVIQAFLGMCHVLTSWFALIIHPQSSSPPWKCGRFKTALLWSLFYLILALLRKIFFHLILLDPLPIPPTLIYHEMPYFLTSTFHALYIPCYWNPGPLTPSWPWTVPPPCSSQVLMTALTRWYPLTVVTCDRKCNTLS